MGGGAPRGADTREPGNGPSEPLSLLDVLRSYEQPINEEQAWAVGFQCCRGLRARDCARLELKGPASILLHRDGAVTLRPENNPAAPPQQNILHYTIHPTYTPVPEQSMTPSAQKLVQNTCCPVNSTSRARI
uniref:KIND domain-containing protein n=1 Tax=Astyanax mexicanus TaxID=7994 RepID=A0A8B9JCD2_ASTMX